MTAKSQPALSAYEHHTECGGDNRTDRLERTCRWADCVALLCSSRLDQFSHFSAGFRMIVRGYCVAALCSKHALRTVCSTIC
jgi:hypothetical protein